jgi:lipoprotein-releasing system permease protein
MRPAMRPAPRDALTRRAGPFSFARMSRLPFELLLALRYLRPKRTFVSVITSISVLGVTLGVAVLIIVISVMSGFDRQLRDKILGFNTHLKILPRDETMKDYAAVARLVAANPRVKAVAPFVLGPVLVETEPPSGQSKVGAPWIRGINPQIETNMSVLPNSIVDGKFDVSDRGLLVGTEFAHNMSLQVGDRVEIGSPSVLKKWRETNKKEGTSAPVLPEYEVRGIFDVGYYEYNVSVVVISLRDAQELYDLGSSVHGLMVMLHDPYQAPAVEEELAFALGPDYQIRSWMQENSNLLNALVVEKNVMFYLLFFIMIVAALCILSALITFVVQKTREIGMLKALGATDLQVSLVFLSQAALVGAIGDLAGYGLGMLALAYRNEFLHFMNRLTGFELFPASIYGFTELPALIIRRDILLICGSAWLVCILGGVIPAWRAGRLKPVEALRYE